MGVLEGYGVDVSGGGGRIVGNSLFPERVTVYEVGPRDGLQNESLSVPTEAKIAYINMLSEAGFLFIEATSFVNPRAVPQLGDAGEVMAGITRRRGTRYPVLVPNERGMQRALEAGVTDVAVFTAASESFTRANINSTIRELIENFEPGCEVGARRGD